MSARQVAWARKVHADLREALGSKCAHCGGTAQLEFDCIKPLGHDHHKAGYVARATFYRRQFKAGNLGLLCEACHAQKTENDRHWLEETIAGIRAHRKPMEYVKSVRTYYPGFDTSRSLGI